MRALPFQAPAPHVYIRMRQANIEKRLSTVFFRDLAPYEASCANARALSL